MWSRQRVGPRDDAFAWIQTFYGLAILCGAVETLKRDARMRKFIQVLFLGTVLIGMAFVLVYAKRMSPARDAVNPAESSPRSRQSQATAMIVQILPTTPDPNEVWVDESQAIQIAERLISELDRTAVITTTAIEARYMAFEEYQDLMTADDGHRVFAMMPGYAESIGLTEVWVVAFKTHFLLAGSNLVPGSEGAKDYFAPGSAASSSYISPSDGTTTGYIVLDARDGEVFSQAVIANDYVIDVFARVSALPTPTAVVGKR